MGVHFAGPAPGNGGAVLNVSALTVDGESEPNALAFDNSASYAGGGAPIGPETITFDTPIHFASIRVGQSTGGSVTLKAFNGTTQVFSDARTSTQQLDRLDVSAERITSLRLEFTGSATVWDDLTWDTAPVSRNDAFRPPSTRRSASPPRACSATTVTPTATR